VPFHIAWTWQATAAAMNLWSSITREDVVPAGYAVALLLLLMLTATLVWRFIWELGRDTPRIESHWGGLGGGLGGWELSRSLVYLLASVSFAILSITVLKGAAEFFKPPTTSSQATAKDATPKDAASNDARTVSNQTPADAATAQSAPSGSAPSAAAADQTKK
jgi:hypothetical protein